MMMLRLSSRSLAVVLLVAGVLAHVGTQHTVAAQGNICFSVCNACSETVPGTCVETIYPRKSVSVCERVPGGVGGCV